MKEYFLTTEQLKNFCEKKWRPIWPPICNQPAASHTGCKKNPSKTARILEGANQNRTDA